MIYTIYDFHRFEGEGGEASGGLGTEASNFLASLGINDGTTEKKEAANAQSDLSQVQYGRSEDGGMASQVGTDTNETQSLEERFQQMISKDGEFHDIYGQRVSQAIQDRFKNQADYQGQVNQYEEALAPLMMKYGLDAGDIEGLTNASASDKDIYRSGAEEAGLDVGQYMERLKLEADAERGRKIMDAYQKQQERNRLFSQWENEANQLKQAFPGFDLGMEIQQNERFTRLLDGGATVSEAFAATHMMEILNGMGQEQRRNAQQDVVQNIQRQASRPMESGMRHAPAIQRRVDPNTFNDADIDEILKRVGNGERFSF